ncbi:MAG: putative bifunctional diguanylate cyclase/phosphodiesterase [Solirubrobacterales bacterium]
MSSDQGSGRDGGDFLLEVVVDAALALHGNEPWGDVAARALARAGTALAASQVALVDLGDGAPAGRVALGDQWSSGAEDRWLAQLEGTPVTGVLARAAQEVRAGRTAQVPAPAVAAADGTLLIVGLGAPAGSGAALIACRPSREGSWLAPEIDGLARLGALLGSALGAERAHEDLRTREAILEAVAFVAGRFYHGTEWEQGVDLALQRLGQAVGVSRITVVENVGETDATLAGTPRMSWSRSDEGGAHRAVPYIAAGCARWIAELRAGRVLAGPATTFPEAERDQLAGIRSTCMVPISVEGEWWGYAALDQVDRDRRWTQGEIRALTAAASALGGAIARRRLLAAQRSSDERFRLIFESAPLGMARIDADGRVIEANVALRQMLGRPDAALVGSSLPNLLPGTDAVEHAMRIRSLLGGESSSASFEHRLSDGEGRSLWARSTLSAVTAADGVRDAVIWIAEDISQRKHAEARLRYVADHDPLTGLANRRRFNTELSRHLARVARYGPTGAVLLLDLDNFKWINDTFGHAAGDEVLTGVARTLRDRLRESDLVARLGGDEFAVLLPRGDTESAGPLASALLDATRTYTPHLAGEAVPLTISIGMTLIDRADLSAEDVLLAADHALYEAKHQGKNQLAVAAKPATNQRVATGLAEASGSPAPADHEHGVDATLADLAADIATDGSDAPAEDAGSEEGGASPGPASDPTRYAAVLAGHDFPPPPRVEPGGDLAAHELELWAQPLRNVASGRVVEYELLLRVRRPGAMELESPLPFLGRVQRAGWSIGVDRWVVSQAVRLLAGTPDAATHLSVNLTSAAIADAGFPAFIDNQLREAGVPASRLGLEVAEPLVLADRDASRRFVSAAASLGCAVSLDDFTLSAGDAVRLPGLDRVKVEPQIIGTLRTDPARQLSLLAILDLAHTAGSAVVAESVPDDGTMDLLGDFGVELGQGFHLGRPRPVEELWPAAVSIE